MILLRRILPFCSAVLLLVLFEIVFSHQGAFWYLLPVLAAVVVFPVGVMFSWQGRHLVFWQQLISPMLLVGSGLFLLLFLSEKIFSHALIVVLVLLFWWYAENLFLYQFRNAHYQPYALEHISLYMNLLSVFFLFSSLYAARVFLNFSVVLLGGIAVVVSALFAIQFSLGSKLPWGRSWPYLLVVAMVMLELFMAIAMLPTTYFVAGILLAVPYYLMMNIARHALRNTLRRSVLVRNIILGIIIFAVTFSTAPWT
ncbi:MAG: hypothetical protein V1778_00630 [bacterium]